MTRMRPSTAKRVAREATLDEIRTALLPDPPQCLSPLNVGDDGSFVLTRGTFEVRRYFDVSPGHLHLTKIAVADAQQRRGLATAATLHVMDRLGATREVTVKPSSGDGRRFWDALSAKGYVHVLTTTGETRQVRLTDHGRQHIRSLPRHLRRRWPWTRS